VDDHELGEARLAKESMVDVEEVHHLDGERLLLEAVWLAEGDVEPDTSERHDLLPRNDPVEQRPAGA
jgi:hypothetical protein